MSSQIYDLPPPVEPSSAAKTLDVRVTNRPGIFPKICWAMTLLGCLMGVAIIILGFASAQGAPQEAVVAALGIACAVIPYCFARAVTELGK